MERRLPVHQIRRLGFREQTAPWSETNLGPGNFAQAYPPSRAARRDSETIRMAFISSHVLHSTAKCRHGVQSDAGVAAAFLLTVHAGCLHAGNLASKTRCASSGPCAGLRFWNKPQRTRVRVVKPVKIELVKTVLIDEKGCKKGAKTCPFAPSLVSISSIQLFWNEWRGRRDSNSRPLP